VGTPSEIVSRTASGSDEIAAKVVAALVNSLACSTATGATIRAASASSGNRRRNSVAGSVSVAETGWRLPSRGLRDSIAWLSDVPRAASPFPNPSRLMRTFSRVSASKVLLMSSNSTCSSVWSAPNTNPSGAGGPSPRVISRYLSPNADR
jgi:hypothetical protein